MVRKLSLLAVTLASFSCASSPQTRCEGTVFFVGVHCKEVPVVEKTPPARTKPAVQQVATKPVVAAKPEPTPATPPPAPTPPPPAVAVAPPQVNIVYFDTGSSELTMDGKVALEAIGDYLRAAPEEHVALYSFADPTGTAERNHVLLGERSRAVQSFLTSLGIAEGRVEMPKDGQRIAGKSFPKADYWRLRKVLVNYSSKANELADKEEKADEVAAEADSQPEPKKAAVVKPGAKEPKEPGIEKIDVMYWKSTNHSLLILAKKLGYFRDEGFDVRLHEAGKLEANQISIAVAEGTTTVRAPGSAMELKTPKYFMGAVCPLGLHDALAKNIPIVQIGGLLANPNTLLMKKELAQALRRDLGAFRGKTIGRNKKNPSDIDYTDLFTNQLRARKIEFKEKIFPTWAAMEDAVARGDADAALSTPPYDQQFIQRHADLDIFELRNLYSNMPCCRQLVTRAQLRDKKFRDKYVRFERALIRAHKYYKENKAATAELVAKVLDLEPGIVRSVFSRRGFDLDPNPNLKGSIAFAKTLQIHKGQDVQESVDTSVYEEALLGLAKANPADSYFKTAIRDYRATN